MSYQIETQLVCEVMGKKSLKRGHVFLIQKTKFKVCYRWTLMTLFLWHYLTQSAFQDIYWGGGETLLSIGRILFLPVLVHSGQWTIYIDEVNHTTRNGIIFKVAITREWETNKTPDYKISFFHELSWLTSEVLVKLSMPQYCQLYIRDSPSVISHDNTFHGKTIWFELSGLCFSKCICWSSSPSV